MSTLTLPAPASTEVTRADVLNRAADIVEEFGGSTGALSIPWEHEQMKTPVVERRYCFIGAVARAAYDLGCEQPGECPWMDYAVAGYFTELSYTDMWMWNDSLPEHARDRQVVARLRKLAEKAT